MMALWAWSLKNAIISYVFKIGQDFFPSRKENGQHFLLLLNKYMGLSVGSRCCKEKKIRSFCFYLPIPFFAQQSLMHQMDITLQLVLFRNILFRTFHEQGNYSLRRPPKLTIPQAVIGRRWAAVNSNLYKQPCMYVCMTIIPALTPS